MTHGNEGLLLFPAHLRHFFIGNSILSRRLYFLWIFKLYTENISESSQGILIYLIILLVFAIINFGILIIRCRIDLGIVTLIRSRVTLFRGLHDLYRCLYGLIRCSLACLLLTWVGLDEHGSKLILCRCLFAGRHCLGSRSYSLFFSCLCFFFSLP